MAAIIQNISALYFDNLVITKKIYWTSPVYYQYVYGRDKVSRWLIMEQTTIITTIITGSHRSKVCSAFLIFNFIFYLFTLLLTPGARLPVLGLFLVGGAFGSNT